MKHFGDITKINGANVPLVDIITGGSPCQDLSVAGKRAGLAGERSGLFMLQVRIIKEMRNESLRQLSMRGATYDMGCIQPRYMVWENVPGAFSSNKGEDFRAVLEETARIKDEDAVIPRPENNKWSSSGCILGDGWSIAWRLHDAQFWGVPQRIKRISLVADFGGTSAPEILFERKSVSGDSEQSREERKDITSDSEGSSCETIGVDSYNLTTTGTVSKTLQAERSDNEHIPCAISFQGRAGKPGGGKGILIQNEHTGALSTLNNQSVVYGICSNNSNSMKSSNPFSGIYEADTSRTLDLNGGSPACNQGGMAVVYDASRRHDYQPFEDDICETVQAHYGTGGGNVPMVLEDAYCVGNGQLNQVYSSKNTGALNCMHDQQCVMYANEAYDKWSESEKSASLRASGGVYGGGSESLSVDSVVRRLTPMECERLQGYPDGWTDIGDWTDSKGKKHKGDADSPRYKALGNSIALPFWEWMAERMVQYIDHDPTMASLFDGIGGFPLVFSRCGCSPVWASEIEEFPIAVTRLRFGGE